MEQVGEENASRKGALANRQRADARALALLPTIQKLMAAGFVSHRGLANELNQRRTPGAAGGRGQSNTRARKHKLLGLPHGGGLIHGFDDERGPDTSAAR